MKNAVNFYIESFCGLSKKKLTQEIPLTGIKLKLKNYQFHACIILVSKRRRQNSEGIREITITSTFYTDLTESTLSNKH